MFTAFGRNARVAKMGLRMAATLPKVPYDSVTPKGPSGPTLPAPGEDLSFLEATPYWDQSNVQVNIAKQKNPLIGKIVSVQRMVGPKAPGETCNIVIDHRGTLVSLLGSCAKRKLKSLTAGELPYWEGQSYGVLPPGIDPKKNKPYGVRLYSIASTRYGTERQI